MKTGYKPYLLEIELDLEGDGYDWEGVVVLEEVEEKRQSGDFMEPETEVSE